MMFKMCKILSVTSDDGNVSWKQLFVLGFGLEFILASVFVPSP